MGGSVQLSNWGEGEVVEALLVTARFSDRTRVLGMRRGFSVGYRMVMMNIVKPQCQFS